MPEYTRETLEHAVSISRSYLETLRNLGVQGISGGSYSHLRRKIIKLGINTSHFSGLSWAVGTTSNFRLPPDKILVVITGHNRAPARKLRRALIESGVPYICNECGSGPEWQGRPLTLEVDHVDGNWRDCRGSNLQFLCPNCHSQKGLTRINTCACGKQIPKKSITCKSCNMKQLAGNKTGGHLEKGTWPDQEELANLVWKQPAVSVASEIGVLSSMLKKRCKRLGINTPPRGYWAKRSALLVTAPSSKGTG